MNICYLSNAAIPSSVASSIQIVKMCEAFSELKNEVTSAGTITGTQIICNATSAVSDRCI